MGDKAIYARVSTKEADFMIASQLYALRDSVKRMGWTDVREFQDVASGKSLVRPGFIALRNLVRRGEIKHVAVYRVDRLTRNMKDFIDTVAEFQQAGCVITFIVDRCDLSTPGGRLQAHILAATAQYEREVVSERVKNGLAFAKLEGTRSGKPIGRPRRDDVDVARAIELRKQGLSWRLIAEAMREPRRTLERKVAAVQREEADEKGA